MLAQLLSDVYLPRSDQLVAENRASGIPIMLTETRRNGLPRPVFRSPVTSFTVTMGRSALLGPEVRTWLNGLPVPLPTPAHEIAMAMMRDGGFVTNAALREWGVDHRAAGSVLRDLTESGVAVRHGGRRYARYVLNPQQPVARGNAVAVALAEMGTATAAELQKRTGMSRAGVTYQLKRLVPEGRVRAIGAPRSPNRTYRWQISDDPV